MLELRLLAWRRSRPRRAPRGVRGRRTFQWFRDNEVALPVSKAHRGKLAVVFQVPRHTFIAYVLHNPFYAGAYATHTSKSCV